MNKFITAMTYVKNGKFVVIGTYLGRCFLYSTDVSFRIFKHILYWQKVDGNSMFFKIFPHKFSNLNTTRLLMCVHHVAKIRSATKSHRWLCMAINCLLRFYSNFNNLWNSFQKTFSSQMTREFEFTTCETWNATASSKCLQLEIEKSFCKFIFSWI